MLTDHHIDEDTICREVLSDSRFEDPILYHDSINHTAFNERSLKYTLKIHVPEDDKNEAELVKLFEEKMDVDHSVGADSPRDVTDPFYHENEDRENEGDTCNSTKKTDTFFSLRNKEKNMPGKESSSPGLATDQDNLPLKECPFVPHENRVRDSTEIENSHDTYFAGGGKEKDVLNQGELPLNNHKNVLREADYFSCRLQKQDTHARPPRPNPSPIHQRLAMAKTKSVALRQGSRGRSRDDYHGQHKARVPFYCTVSSSSVTSGLTSDSLLSSSSSEDSAQEKKLHRIRARSQDRIKQAMSIARSSSPFHERLAIVETKSVALRRISELADKKKKSSSTGHQRPAFYCTVNPSSSASSSSFSGSGSSESSESSMMRSRTPKRETSVLNHSPLFRGDSPILSKRTDTSGREISPRPSCQFYQGHGHTKVRGKLSSFETQSLYHRLSRHDTVATSKRLMPSPGRKVLRSPYEQSKMERKTLMDEKKRSRKTTNDFFDRMSRDQTFSSFSKTQILGLPTDKLPEV